MERVFSIVKDCTFPQLWNSAEYGISKFRGFPSTYLKYNPPGLFLFITSRCNRNCKFCGYHSPNRPSNYRLDFPDMSMDAFKWIINRFSHAVDIEFGGGGEPFLHSHIFEMIDYAQEHGILSMIPTNGTFLHDVLDRVVRFPVLLLNISLNACDSGYTFTKNRYFQSGRLLFCIRASYSNDRYQVQIRIDGVGWDVSSNGVFGSRQEGRLACGNCGCGRRDDLYGSPSLVY